MGIFASEFKGVIIHKIAGIALILMSFLLLVSTISVSSHRLHMCRVIPNLKGQTPIIFGFLTGINICPPFLLAISYATSLGNVADSLLLFLGFFIGTSIFLLALLPAGFACRYENIRIIGKITAILTSILFIALGIEYCLN